MIPGVLSSVGQRVQLAYSALIVGGGGLQGTTGGGGGGGGVQAIASNTLKTRTAYSITVGAAGQNSSFNGYVASAGATPATLNGGSSGAPTSHAGGTGVNNYGPGGGGGGGASGPGQAGTSTLSTHGQPLVNGGNGGLPVSSQITGGIVYYGGGGGGWGSTNSGTSGGGQASAYGQGSIGYNSSSTAQQGVVIISLVGYTGTPQVTGIAAPTSTTHGFNTTIFTFSGTGTGTVTF